MNRSRDGLNSDLLSDPDLAVIRTYGVEHHMTLGRSPLLIDETGVIRWVDQTDDYRLRSSTDRVMTIGKQVFD